jgi:hypothetical protein
MKMDVNKIDTENLDELIKMCEDSMISPFKKKKAAVEVVPEQEESAEQPKEPKEDLSEMDLQDLLEMYKELKEAE